MPDADDAGRAIPKKMRSVLAVQIRVKNTLTAPRELGSTSGLRHLRHRTGLRGRQLPHVVSRGSDQSRRFAARQLARRRRAAGQRGVRVDGGDARRREWLRRAGRSAPTAAGARRRRRAVRRDARWTGGAARASPGWLGRCWRGDEARAACPSSVQVLGAAVRFLDLQPATGKTSATLLTLPGRSAVRWRRCAAGTRGVARLG